MSLYPHALTPMHSGNEFNSNYQITGHISMLTFLRESIGSHG